MDLNKNYIKNKILLKDSTNPNKIVDKYINVMLTKTCEVYEYVDVKKDEKIFTIDRQAVNPYYIDFGFFGTIRRIKVNSSADLTPTMIDYLNSNYLSGNSNSNITKTWFDSVGYNQLLLEKNTETGDNGLDGLEKLEHKINSAVSKANYFPILINK
jgi:hypothetical protein